MALLALHFWRETTLILLLIFMQLGARGNCEPTQDKEALLAFMARIPHENRVNWNATESVCEWFGVQCDASHSFVESLHLPGVGLVGSIPSNTIGRLTHLRFLSLRHNALTGEIPVDFSNLMHLRNLYLQNNNFSGEFPISLIRLSRLARLDLSFNNISGSIPSSISNLTHLTGFNVSNNRLNGCIPESLINSPSSSFSGNMGLYGGTLKPCNPFLLSPVQAPSPLPSPSPMLLLSPVLSLSPLQSPSSVHPPVMNVKSKTNSLSVGTIIVLVVCSIVVVLLLVLILFLCFCCRSAKPPQAEVAEAPGDALVAAEEGTSSSRDESVGSLFALLHGNKGSGRTPLDWKSRMRIAIGTARDLALLHMSRKLVHGNLKSSNILLSQNLEPIFQNSSTEANNLAGYQAPEHLESQQPTFESDVYSFGVLLLELLTGKTPNQESLREDMEDLPRWVQSVIREEWTTEVFDEELLRYHNSNEEEMIHLLTIAMKCVSVEPDHRPTMQEVVRLIEAINRSEIDEVLRQSSDDPSNGSNGSMVPYFHTNNGNGGLSGWVDLLN